MVKPRALLDMTSQARQLRSEVDRLRAEHASTVRDLRERLQSYADAQVTTMGPVRTVKSSLLS